MEVTDQPRWTATLHMRDPGRWLMEEAVEEAEVRYLPRNPLPPQTTIFFAMRCGVGVFCRDGSLFGEQRVCWVMESKGY